MRRGLDVCDALRTSRAQVENCDDSPAVDVAIGDHARTAGQVEPERRTGERDHAIVKSSGITRATASRVARGCYGIHSAQIVGSLVPGIHSEQKTAAAGHFLHLIRNSQQRRDRRSEIRGRQKDRLANMRHRRWFKHPGGVLFPAQIAAQHQAPHAVGHDVHLIDGRPIGVTQPGEKFGERRGKILNAGGGKQTARAEEQARLTVGLEHLVRDSEGVGKVRRANFLVSVDEHNGRKRSARNRRSVGNELGLRFGQQQARQQTNY